MCLVLILAPVPGDGLAVMTVGVVVITSITSVRLVRRQRMARGTVVRFSPDGVEMEDVYGTRARMAWRHIERIDVVESRVPSDRSIVGPGGIRVRKGDGQCIGVVGWGDYEISSKVPGWMLSHLSRIPIDPTTGLQRVSIPLGVVDPLWAEGPMGTEIGHRRADLFQPTGVL